MSYRRRTCTLPNDNLDDIGIKMVAFEEYSKSSCLLECRDDFKQSFNHSQVFRHVLINDYPHHQDMKLYNFPKGLKRYIKTVAACLITCHNLRQFQVVSGKMSTIQPATNLALYVCQM